MPQYRFGCEGCHKVVSRIEPVGTKQISCPTCGLLADRLPPLSQTHSFDPPSAITPQNTGVADLDYIADLAIGKSAAEGKEAQIQREAVKRNMLRGLPGIQKADLWRTPDGEYFVAPEPLRKGVRELSDSVTRKPRG